MENFEQQVNSNDWGHRIRVAENPNTPLYILEELSIDEDYFVRSYVADNPNCPPKLKQAIKSCYQLYCYGKL